MSAVTLRLPCTISLILRGETGLGDLAGADPRGYAWVAVGLLGTAGSSIYAHRFLRSANA